MTKTIDWTTVQQKAIQYGMFSPDSTIESIQDLIKSQETIVLESGCTFEQIGEFFNYFTLCIKHSPRVTQDNLDIKSCFPEFLKLNREHWSLGGVSEHDIVFFGTQYTVVVFSWMGSADCPFDKCRGRGSQDYLVYRKDIGSGLHIGSLLFHQITEHHFFQSVNSSYHVDPKTLLEFFNITPGISYKINCTVKKYRLWSGGGSLMCTNLENWTLVAQTAKYKLYTGDPNKPYNAYAILVLPNDSTEKPEMQSEIIIDNVSYTTLGEFTTFYKEIYEELIPL